MEENGIEEGAGEDKFPEGRRMSRRGSEIRRGGESKGPGFERLTLAIGKRLDNTLVEILLRLEDLEQQREEDVKSIEAQVPRIEELKKKNEEDSVKIEYLEKKLLEECILLHCVSARAQSQSVWLEVDKVYRYDFTIRGVKLWISDHSDLQKESEVWHIGQGQPHLKAKVGICDHKGKQCIFADLYSSRCPSDLVSGPEIDTSHRAQVKLSAGGQDGVGEEMKIGSRTFSLNGKNDEWKRWGIDQRNTPIQDLEDKKAIFGDKIVLHFDIQIKDI